MVEKKSDNKGDNEKKDKEIGVSKPDEASKSPLDSGIRFSDYSGSLSNLAAFNSINTSLNSFSNIGSYCNSINTALNSFSNIGNYTNSINMTLGSLSGLSGLVNLPNRAIEQELEDKIDELNKEKRKLVQEVEEKSDALNKKEITIEELKKSVQNLIKKDEEISKQLKLQYLLSRVHEIAWKKLSYDEEFRKLFEQKSPCSMVIMSIDIRRSTELMLKAKDAESYQKFIMILCTQLKQIILNNYGIFDKFTGDGILSFFPNFYTGDDAIYWAIKAADECHACFRKHYEANRNGFTTVLKDTGLGIGIDYGDSYIVNMQDWLTVIGAPVVYACRLSGGPAGTTLLNQQAYEIVTQKFGGCINLQESEIEIKHEGYIITYQASLNKRAYQPGQPNWSKEEPEGKKQSSSLE